MKTTKTTLISLQIEYPGNPSEALKQFQMDFRSHTPMSFSVLADDGEVVAFTILDGAKWAEAFLLVEPEQTAKKFALN